MAACPPEHVILTMFEVQFLILVGRAPTWDFTTTKFSLFYGYIKKIGWGHELEVPQTKGAMDLLLGPLINVVLHVPIHDRFFILFSASW